VRLVWIQNQARLGGGGGSWTRVRSSVLRDLYERVQDFGSRLAAPPGRIRVSQPRWLSYLRAVAPLR